ncbi:MAG TPA: tetratricopeptide repeat protein, partial [Pyrinomonadaceae bacterium]
MSRNRTKRAGSAWRPALASALAALTLCAPHARAQEGDLTSSAGVFIEPARKRAAAPRERRAPQRTPPRRSASRPKAAPTPTPTPVKTPGRNAPPPVTAESLNARAEQAIDAGRFADAVEPLRQALRLKPDYPDAQYNL